MPFSVTVFQGSKPCVQAERDNERFVLMQKGPFVLEIDGDSAARALVQIAWNGRRSRDLHRLSIGASVCVRSAQLEQGMHPVMLEFSQRRGQAATHRLDVVFWDVKEVNGRWVPREGPPAGALVLRLGDAAVLSETLGLSAIEPDPVCGSSSSCASTDEEEPRAKLSPGRTRPTNVSKRPAIATSTPQVPCPACAEHFHAEQLKLRDQVDRLSSTIASLKQQLRRERLSMKVFDRLSKPTAPTQAPTTASPTAAARRRSSGSVRSNTPQGARRRAVTPSRLVTSPSEDHVARWEGEQNTWKAASLLVASHDVWATAHSCDSKQPDEAEAELQWSTFGDATHHFMRGCDA